MESRYTIRIGPLKPKLTIGEMQKAAVEIRAFLMERDMVQKNPEVFREELHGDLFSEEEKINL